MTGTLNRGLWNEQMACGPRRINMPNEIKGIHTHTLNIQKNLDAWNAWEGPAVEKEVNEEDVSVRNMVFLNFFFLKFYDFLCLLYPSPLFSSQFYSSRKDNMRAIDQMT